SGQQIALDQTAAARATATQSDTSNGSADSGNSSAATATATAEDANDQSVTQDAAPGGGDHLSQWAGQLTVVAQDVQSDAQTVQHGARGHAAAAATATAHAGATTGQTSTQAMGGDGGTRTQTSQQMIGVDQVATAASLTADGANGVPSGAATSSA